MPAGDHQWYAYIMVDLSKALYVGGTNCPDRRVSVYERDHGTGASRTAEHDARLPAQIPPPRSASSESHLGRIRRRSAASDSPT
jgi:hypothetical protein